MDNIQLSDDDSVKSTKIGDTTCEYIGFIKSTEGPKEMSNGKKLFKGVICFQGGLSVNFVLWNKIIDKLESSLIRNHIVHFENGYANTLNLKYNKNAEVNFEFVFNEATIVNDLGEYQGSIEHVTKESFELVELKHLFNGDHENVEMKDVFLKTCIASSSNGTNISQFCSITDGTFKFDVKFGCNMNSKDFQKGVPVHVKGKVIKDGLPYIKVTSSENFTLRDGEMLTMERMIGATGTPKRKCTSPLTEPPSKIPKY